LEPINQGSVIRAAPDECLREVHMYVNQARQHHFPSRIDLEFRTVLRPNVTRPPNLRDYAIINENRTIPEYSAMRVHSNYYAALYEN
jgi:hypothetical protein